VAAVAAECDRGIAQGETSSGWDFFLRWLCRPASSLDCRSGTRAGAATEIGALRGER